MIKRTRPGRGTKARGRSSRVTKCRVTAPPLRGGDFLEQNRSGEPAGAGGWARAQNETAHRCLVREEYHPNF